MSYISVLTIPKAILSSLALTDSPEPKPAFAALPNELLEKILASLSIFDRTALCQSCKRFSSFASCPGILSLSPTHDGNLILFDDFFPITLTKCVGTDNFMSGLWEEDKNPAHEFLFECGDQKTRRTVTFPCGGYRLWNWALRLNCMARQQGFNCTKGLASLATLKASMMIDEYESLKNSGRVAFLTLRYRRPQTQQG